MQTEKPSLLSVFLSFYFFVHLNLSDISYFISYSISYFLCGSNHFSAYFSYSYLLYLSTTFVHYSKSHDCDRLLLILLLQISHIECILRNVIIFEKLYLR